MDYQKPIQRMKEKLFFIFKICFTIGILFEIYVYFCIIFTDGIIQIVESSDYLGIIIGLCKIISGVPLAVLIMLLFALLFKKRNVEI